MAIQQNVRHRAVAAARHALDNGEIDEVIRELVARAATTTTSAKPKVTTTTAAAKITLITPPKVATTTAAKTTASVSAKVAASASSSASSAASTTSVASSTSVSSTSSIISTSSLTSSTLSSTLLPSTTLNRALASSSESHLPSSTSSSSAGAESSSGIGTSTLIGVVAGALGAVLIISMVAGFFLRRMRTKRKGGAEVFDAAEFRRSAVLLEEKDKNQNQKPDFRPRPPTMIERHVKGAPGSTNGSHNSNVPPMPTMAYGHHQGSYPQYGGINIPPHAPGAMYNGVPVVPPPGPYGAHYDQAGYGAPPVPGTYAPGAYAPYGADPRFQQQQHQQQQQRYPQYSSYQHPGQLYPGGGPGGMYAPLPQHPHQQHAHGQMDSMGALPNPFARSPAPSTAPPSPIADRHPQQNLHLASSSGSSSRNGHGHGDEDEDEAGERGAPPPAYVDETGEGGKYRDVKMKPVQLSPPTASASASAGTGSSSTSAAAAAAPSASPSPAARRTSAYSTYDHDDVYGGI